MRRLKTSTIWIITGIVFVITMCLLFSAAFTNGVWNKMVVVLIVIGFILLTLLVQYASFKTFQYKKKIKYPVKSYIFNGDIEKLLIDKGFKERKTNHGLSYLLIKNKVAYKVVLVDDSEKYFEPVEEKNVPKNKELDNCKSFIAFELFYNITSDLERKIVEFSIQGDKVYYTAFTKTDDGFYCHNYLEPLGVHIDNYNELINILGFQEKQ